MPQYGSNTTTNTPLTLLSPDDLPFLLFNAELPTTGQNSIAVGLNHNTARRIVGIALELIFAASPGTFTFNIQGADTEANPSYLNEASGVVTTSTGPQSDGSFHARLELSPWVAKFARLACVAQTANGVAVTAKISAF